MALESMQSALARLEGAGYTDEFRAEEGGLRHLPGDHVMAPEELLVREVVRFEGASDPDEMAAVFALECTPCGVKGTYTVAFGPEIDALDAEVVPRLPDARTPPQG
jgi:hypothetical protein